MVFKLAVSLCGHALNQTHFKCSKFVGLRFSLEVSPLFFFFFDQDTDRDLNKHILSLDLLNAQVQRGGLHQTLGNDGGSPMS